MTFLQPLFAKTFRCGPVVGDWLRRIMVCGIVAVMCLGLGLPQPVKAQTRIFTVNRADDIEPRGADVTCLNPASGDCTLREAILKANQMPGSVIQFSPELNGTPVILTRADPEGSSDENAALTGDLDITASVTIQGNGPENTIIQGAQDAAFTNSINNRIFSINDSGVYSNLEVSLTGLTIRYGSNALAGGGLSAINRGEANAITLTDLVIEGNRSYTRGGGMDVGSAGAASGTVRLERVTFRSNQTLMGILPAHGGALGVISSQLSVVIADSLFLNNTAEGQSSRGGAVAFFGTGGSLEISNTVFRENQAGSLGGGLFLNIRRPNVTVTVHGGSWFENNVSGAAVGGTSGGGAIAVTGNTLTNTPLLFSQITLVGNRESVQATNNLGGGGMYINVGSVTLEYSRIVNNQANRADMGFGLHKSAQSGTVTAINNWWGCSSGPAAAPCDTAVLAAGSTGSLTASPYLVATTTADPAALVTNQTAQVTVSLGVNSAGEDVSAQLGAMAGAPVAWSAAGGLLTDQQTTLQAGGLAAATYQADAANAGNQVTALVDNDQSAPLPRPNVLAIPVERAGVAVQITADLPDPSEIGTAFTAAASVTGVYGNAPTAPGGTITIGNGVDSCSAVLPETSCSLVLNSAGAQVLTASYSGDANFAPASSPGEPHEVVDNRTTILTDLSTPTVTGEALAVAFRVVPVQPDYPFTPTGTVTISAGSGVICTAALPADTCVLVFPTAGTYTLTAYYSGDAHFTPSVSAGIPHEVRPAETSTTILSALPNPALIDEVVTVRFEVNVVPPGSTANGATPITGLVIVSDGAGTTCTAALPAASCDLVFHSAGIRSLTAAYQGDDNFNASTSAAVTHITGRIPTTTTITSTVPAPSVTGQVVTVHFSVDAPGTATGTVTVTDGSASCSADLPSTSCTLTFPAAGAYMLTASYSGDAFYLPSQSAPVTHTVQRAATTLAIVSSTPNPSLTGEAVTVTFELNVAAPGAGTPTGDVTISDGVDACTAALPETSCTLTLTTQGERTLTAVYAGDSNFAGSTSAGVTHTVAGRGVVVTLTPPASSVTGETVSIGAVVTADDPANPYTPSGDVTISAGAGLECTFTLPAAACDLTFPAAGDYTLSAAYAGDAHFAPGVSAEVAYVVNPADTSTTIVSHLPDPSAAGQPVTVSVEVTAVAPGSGTPTGTVTVQAVDSGGNTYSCAAELPDASCDLTLPTVGSYVLSAAYAGDANFLPSEAAAAAHTVEKDSTVTTLEVLSAESVVGEAVRVRFNVAGVHPGSGAPTGSVIVSGGDASCLTAVSVGWCDLIFVNVGVKTITARYLGDDNHQASLSAPVEHTVRKAATIVTLTGDPDGRSEMGEAVLFQVGVAVQAPGGGTPTGSVTISDGVNACTVTLPNTTCSITWHAPGDNLLTATYSGDNKFLSGTSAAVPHHVLDNRVDIALSLPDSSVTGEAVAAAFTLTPLDALMPFTPGGTVTISAGVLASVMGMVLGVGAAGSRQEGKGGRKVSPLPAR